MPKVADHLAGFLCKKVGRPRSREVEPVDVMWCRWFQGCHVRVADVIWGGHWNRCEHEKVSVCAYLRGCMSREVMGGRVVVVRERKVDVYGGVGGACTVLCTASMVNVDVCAVGV